MRYRIRRDGYLGYEVVVKRWWWSPWVQYRGSNTFKTIEEARNWVFDVVEEGNS